MEKNKTVLSGIVWSLTAVTAIGIGIFFRLYPLTVYPEYAARNKAEVVVYSSVQKSIEQFIAARAPNLSADEKSTLKKNAFKQYLTDKKMRIDGMVDEMTRKIYSEAKTQNSTPYLMEVDPYYYLSLTRRLLEQLPPRPIRDREYLNENMLAPVGAWYPIDYHPYTGLLIYKIVSVFVRGVPLEIALGYTPLFLASLCVIPFFLITSRVFQLGPGPSLVGASYLLLAPVYLRRSLWGWFDTDSYNIFFPLLILFCVFFYLRENQSKKKKIAYLLLAGIMAGVYSLFWRGWLLETALIAAAVLLTLRKKGLRDFLLLLATPFALTFFLWGWPGLSSLLKEAADLTKSFFLPSFDLWPDAFLTVGELKHSTPWALVQALGGVLAMVLFFTGVVTETRDSAKNNPGLKSCFIFTALLFILTALVGISIERFALLAVAPLALGVSFGAARVAQWSKKSKLFSPASVRNFCFALFLAHSFWQAHLAVRFEHPIYNSSWDKTMTYLRENTPTDAIVTSWWCPGHYITSMAKRRVTFDGATQNTPQIYWVANLFLEHSERKAAAILRMLDLSANGAAEFLETKMKLSEAVPLIHEILSLKKNEALERLKTRLGAPDAARVVGMTHGTHSPPPAYVLIYNDMVDQVMALEYTGKRNFAKAEQFAERLERAPSQIPKKLLDRSSKEHVLLTWSLAEGPYAQDNESFEDHRSGQTVYFSNGLALDPLTMDARLLSPKFGSGKPKYIYSLNGDYLERKTVEGATLGISALLIKDEALSADGQLKITYRTVLADERLLESLVFRLYYLKGRGLHHFQLVSQEENPANRTKLYVYRVDWDAEEP